MTGIKKVRRQNFCVVWNNAFSVGIKKMAVVVVELEEFRLRTDAGRRDRDANANNKIRDE